MPDLRIRASIERIKSISTWPVPTLRPKSIYPLAVIVFVSIFLPGNLAPVEVSMQGDVISVNAIFKTIYTDGSVYGTPQLAWPEGIPPYDYPLPNQLTVWLLSMSGGIGSLFGMDDHFGFVRLFYSVLAFLNLISMYAATRLFGVNRLIAVGAAVAFGTLPYFASRLSGHFFLADLYVVPLALFVASRALRQSEESNWVLPSLCALIAGSGSIYYTFFAAFVVSFILMGQLATAELWCRAKFTGWLLCCLVAPLVIFLVVAKVSSSGSIVPSRSINAQQLYAFRAPDAFLPHIAPLERFFSQYEKFRPATEGTEFVGYPALLGLILATVLFARSFSDPDLRSDVGRLIVFFAAAGFVLTEFALPYGLGMIFSGLNPIIRSQNRISPFLSGIGIITLSLFLQWIWVQVRWRLLFGGLAAVAVIMTVASNYPYAQGGCANPSNAKGTACAGELKLETSVIYRVARATGLKRVVLLPVHPFAEAGPRGERSDYFPFIPYVLEPRDVALQYSAGVTRSQALYKRLTSAEQLLGSGAAAAGVEELRRIGYELVVVDRHALEDGGRSLGRELIEGGAIRASENSAYSVFYLVTPASEWPRMGDTNVRDK